MPTSLTIVQKFYPDVTKVVNARANLRVDLRRADVTKAKVRKHNACAMAEACKRQCKADGAIVSTGAAYLIKGATATKYFVPSSVAREIVAFDRGAGFPAGEYTLYTPYRKKQVRAKGRKGSTTPRPYKARRSPGLRTALSAL